MRDAEAAREALMADVKRLNGSLDTARRRVHALEAENLQLLTNVERLSSLLNVERGRREHVERQLADIGAIAVPLCDRR